MATMATMATRCENSYPLLVLHHWPHCGVLQVYHNNNSSNAGPRRVQEQDETVEERKINSWQICWLLLWNKKIGMSTGCVAVVQRVLLLRWTVNWRGKEGGNRSWTYINFRARCLGWHCREAGSCDGLTKIEQTPVEREQGKTQDELPSMYLLWMLKKIYVEKI